MNKIQILSIIVAVFIITIMTLFALRKVSAITLYISLGLSALFAYKILPKLKK